MSPDHSVRESRGRSSPQLAAGAVLAVAGAVIASRAVGAIGVGFGLLGGVFATLIVVSFCVVRARLGPPSGVLYPLRCILLIGCLTVVLSTSLRVSATQSIPALAADVWGEVTPGWLRSASEFLSGFSKPLIEFILGAELLVIAATVFVLSLVLFASVLACVGLAFQSSIGSAFLVLILALLLAATLRTTGLVAVGLLMWLASLPQLLERGAISPFEIRAGALASVTASAMLVMVALLYLASPADFVPEAVLGPAGLVEDLGFLGASLVLLWRNLRSAAIHWRLPNSTGAAPN